MKMLRFLASRKNLFRLVAGVCVFGIVINFSNFKDLTLRYAYKTVSSMTNYVSEKGNISDIPATISSGILHDHTTAPATVQTSTLAEVHPITTTMTFNKSLEVRCKESPYIECAPPVVRATREKMFKASFLNLPNWRSISPLNHCRYNQCHFVDNNVRNDTDLVVVFGVGLSEAFKLPQRWNYQRYAIYWMEPPAFTESAFIHKANSKWNQQFNLTVYFRLDSDVFNPFSRLAFRPQPLEKRPNYYEIARNKTKTAVWVVSNCNTPSKRDQYVKEMQKYIDVDIFGRCGQPCSRKGDNMCGNLLPEYKFYLSFENSLCDDYVTEKFFKLFLPGVRMVPVVRGGADYKKYFPNLTYINAADFRTAKDLALHLKNLASDLETYSKYLEYKDLYVTSHDHNVDIFCTICQYLHTNNGSPPKTYNLKTWASDSHCHEPKDL